MAFTAQEIKDYIEAVQYDPVAIAQTAGKFGVSMDDIASAMGYNTEQVVNYLKDGLQNAGMAVYFEGGEQQGEAGSTYTPMTISSFSKPVEGSKRKYEAFSPDMQSRGIIDNGSLASQILSDLGPVLSMAIPFAGAELASVLGVSTATGTALVNAGIQVAQGADASSILKGLATSQVSQAVSPMVASELQNITSDPAMSKLITNIGTTVFNSALTGNTDNIGKTILGSAVGTIVGEQTGNSTLGNVAGAAVTGGEQGAAQVLAGSTGDSTVPTIETYPETDTGLPSLLASTPDISTITAPTGIQSLQNILGDSSNQIISDAPFVAAPETTPAVKTTPDYSGQTFGSAFSAARASGDSVFNWNGKAYNTNLAPAPTYDSVGGGRGGQGGPTAEQLAAYTSPIDINDISASPSGVKTKPTGTETGQYPPMTGTFKQAPRDQVSKFSNAAMPGTVDGRSLNLPTFDIGNSGENYISRFIKAAETGGFLNPNWGLYKPGVQIMASDQPNTTNYESGTAAYVPVREYPGTTGTVMLTDTSRYTPSQAANLLSHELVHVNQPLGTLNEASNYFRKGFSKNLTDIIPYLQKEYGYWGGYDDAKTAPDLKERMADFQGYQFNQGIDFAKDPVFKSKVLSDPHAAAMWNANTIERSTRLDARDLPPGKITSSDYPRGSVPWSAQIGDAVQNFVNPNRRVNQPVKIGFAEGGMTESKIMSDEELYQLTGSWEAAAALRDQQRQAPAAEAPQFTPLSATPTLAELKAMYKQMGATQARENVTEQGTTIDYIPVQYGGGWMAGEKDNRKIIDYIGSGMDATPVYDDAPKTLGGFSRQEGDYIYNYDPEGQFLGRTKWNESDLKRIIKDLGPLAMAAVTMGGGGAFLGNSLFGLTGNAAAAAGGALAGGINAYGNDQDILKGALLGGVSGAGTAKLSDILGADTLGSTFKNATLGDVTKAINFAKDPTLAGAANLASPYVTTNFNIGDTGFTTNDILKGLNTAQALGSGDNQKIFNTITGLVKGTDFSGLTASEQAERDANRETARLNKIETDRLNRIENAVLNQPASDDGSTQGIVDLISEMYPAANVKGMSQGDLAKFLEANINEIQGSADLETLLKGAGQTTADEGTVTVTGDRPTGLGDFMVPTTDTSKGTVIPVDNPEEVVITADRPTPYISSLRTKEIKSDIPDELTVDDIDKLFPNIDFNDILQMVVADGTKTVTPGGTKTVVPTKTTTPGTKTTEQSLTDLGLNAPMPSQDPYANIKLMEELFGGDTAYKLRALGAPKNLASADIDALARMLRG